MRKYISYMPLAHSFEWSIISYIVQNEGSIGFYHGDMLKLLEDVKIF